MDEVRFKLRSRMRGLFAKKADLNDEDKMTKSQLLRYKYNKTLKQFTADANEMESQNKKK